MSCLLKPFYIIIYEDKSLLKNFAHKALTLLKNQTTFRKSLTTFARQPHNPHNIYDTIN